MHQLIRRYIEKVDFAAGPKLLRSRPIVFAFLLRPEAEIEDDIRSQFKRSPCDVPQHRFNETMPSIMFWLLSILPEQTYVPFIRCQSKGRLLTLKLLRKRGFSRARKSNHQMESRHTSSSLFITTRRGAAGARTPDTRPAFIPRRTPRRCRHTATVAGMRRMRCRPVSPG